MKKIINEAEFSAEQLDNISALSQSTGLCPETVKILYGRGVDTADKIKAFISPGKDKFLSPLLMRGMKESVRLISRAREEDWSVVIYGDYDADGVCASTVLCRALASYGIDARVFVPERKNGYGLNVNSIDEIFEEYFPQLFITVDCGISNAQEVEYIKEQGAEVIVTDHHELPEELPDCICINPKIADEYPYDNLCGAGVAFKLACALIGKQAYSLLDFTAIATVADSVPLTGENRDIVAEGLRQINSSPRKNYANFLKKEEKALAQSLAFSVAPKINAAGRMGDAGAALTLFLSDDDKTIYDYSVKLVAYNVERQKYCDELYSSAKELLKRKGVKGRVIVLAGENWNAGFVGIVAARLADEYCRPALLFVRHGDSLKGSARSVEGVNIYEALKACEKYISEFGGHSQAAGVNVSVDNLPALERALDDYLHDNYPSEAFTPGYYVNGVYRAPLSQKFVRELNRLEPFGVGNRRPAFVLEAGALRARLLKENSPHVSIKGEGMDFIFFSGARYGKIIKSRVPKRIVFEFGTSFYGGRETVQGYVRDVIYGRDGCVLASEEANLNSLARFTEQAVDCDVTKIGKAEAQALLDGSGEYGTAFVATCISTLQAYDCRDLEVNLFSLSSGNLSNVIVVSPVADCDLSGYENVVYLDDPHNITLPSLKVKRIKVCTETDGNVAFSSLNADRDALITVFRQVGANAAIYTGDSLEDIASGYDFGVTPLQALFSLKVFEQLGIISLNGGRLTVSRGIKTQLTNSELYNFVLNGD